MKENFENNYNDEEILEKITIKKKEPKKEIEQPRKEIKIEKPQRPLYKEEKREEKNPYGAKSDKEIKTSSDPSTCPICGGKLQAIGGCFQCPNDGYSKCD